MRPDNRGLGLEMDRFAGTVPNGPRHILFDITLSYRSIGARPDGILRAERAFARALLGRSDLDVTFCRYERRTGRLVRIATEDARFIVSYVRHDARRRRKSLTKIVRDLAELARSDETRRYRWLRWDLARIMRRYSPSRYVDAQAIAPGTVYVLSGLTFDTHDLGKVTELKHATGMSVFAVCYDLLPVVHPEFFQSDEVVGRFRRQTAILLACADRLAAISDSARNDLERFADNLSGPSPDLTTLRLGFDIPASPGRRPEVAGDLRDRGFVLCVGNINIRKNHVLLYRLWRRLAEERGEDLPQLVFAGRVGWRIGDLLERIRSDPLTSTRIVLVHEADDEALAWLYAHCLFTLYPSFYEGWGLPVSESLAFGRYCITTSTSSLPEAAAGFAATLDPSDDDAWAAAVNELLDDRQALEAHERGIRDGFRVRSWDDAGRDFIEQVLSTPQYAATQAGHG